jgi:hypothetical protein
MAIRKYLNIEKFEVSSNPMILISENKSALMQHSTISFLSFSIPIANLNPSSLFLDSVRSPFDSSS